MNDAEFVLEPEDVELVVTDVSVELLGVLILLLVYCDMIQKIDSFRFRPQMEELTLTDRRGFIIKTLPAKQSLWAS